MDAPEPLPGTRDEAERQLKRIAQAVVRCDGYRCLAYQDKNGIWRSIPDDKELQVVEVVVQF